MSVAAGSLNEVSRDQSVTMLVMQCRYVSLEISPVKPCSQLAFTFLSPHLQDSAHAVTMNPAYLSLLRTRSLVSDCPCTRQSKRRTTSRPRCFEHHSI